MGLSIRSAAGFSGPALQALRDALCARARHHGLASAVAAALVHIRGLGTI